ncbi:Solute carrier family 35 member B1-like [Durusdinium trenchii]|uniref:Solute carrier family 35 member B1-like n=1 Tax=Durusdinium trenchii TaxID=1381693 RepID=A0ABP0QNI7_9DINO
MARLILSIFLSLPVLTCTVKTHITVRTVKEELNIQNVEHPDDGVIVRIIDPPQDSPEEAAEAPADAEHSEHAEAAEAHGHEEEAHGEAHADDHAADAHGQSEEHEDDPVESTVTVSIMELMRRETMETMVSMANMGSTVMDMGAHEGHGHHAPDEKTLTASYMLIGGVTLVMAMFYLVQHPDLDIRYYSWNILTLSACIFIAVLASDVVNQCAKRFLFSGIKVGGWGPVLLDVALAVMWFLASQLVTAALSGAFGEEAKEPKDASSEEERQELEELWEQRETAMKCWGGLVAHCAGFAIVATLASLQDSEPFSSSPGMSLAVVPAALLLVTLLYRLAAFTRKKISEMDDGVVSRGEALWDEISEEAAENESLCLGLSFAAIRSISFFAIGAMPDTHFHIYSDVSNANWHRGWMVLAGVSVGCMVMGIITLKIKESAFGGHGHGAHQSDEHGGHEVVEHDEDDIRLRGLLILSETFIMSFSWGMLSCSISMLNAFLPHLEHHLIGHLIVALVVSALSCVMLVSLDKVADYLKASGDADSAVHIIQHIILAHGLLIGISWEVCFAIGMHAIGHAMEGPNVDVYLALFLCLVVVPAYRLFMLPELKQREAKVKCH